MTPTPADIDEQLSLIDREEPGCDFDAIFLLGVCRALFWVQGKGATPLQYLTIHHRIPSRSH